MIYGKTSKISAIESYCCHYLLFSTELAAPYCHEGVISNPKNWKRALFFTELGLNIYIQQHFWSLVMHEIRQGCEISITQVLSMHKDDIQCAVSICNFATYICFGL